MITNKEIKLINSLKKKSNRTTESLFVVEGEKNVNELIISNFEIKEIYATSDWEQNINFQKVSPKELARISSLSTPNKVLALVKTPVPTILNNKVTTLVIDGVNDPGNLGTIIRTADWFGITQIICSENSVDIYNSKTIMASMGSIFRMKVVFKNLHDYFTNNKLPVYGALLSGDSIYDTKFNTPCILLLGSESHGISEKILPFITHKTTIPGSGQAESLNLGISTAIYCSEYFKQQTSSK